MRSYSSSMQYKQSLSYTPNCLQLKGTFSRISPQAVVLCFYDTHIETS